MTCYEELIMDWYNKKEDPYILDNELMDILEQRTEEELDGLFPYEILCERSTPYKDWLTEVIDEFMKVKFPFE